MQEHYYMSEDPASLGNSGEFGPEEFNSGDFAPEGYTSEDDKLFEMINQQINTKMVVGMKKVVRLIVEQVNGAFERQQGEFSKSIVQSEDLIRSIASEQCSIQI